MSDQQPLPPLPPQNPEVIAPTPPQVLPYAQAGGERPGILMALGILSIIFGGLGALTNVCSAGQSIFYLFLPRIMSNVTAGSPTTVPVNPLANLPAAPYIASAVLSLGNLALAVYLLICGILVLRERINGRKHHLRYAILKLLLAVPVAIVEGWTAYAMQNAVLTSVPSPAGPGGAGSPAMLFTVGAATAGFWLLLSLAYPVAVIIVMRRPQIRGYYAHLAEVGRY